MKILQVTNGYPPEGLGGVEIYTHDLAQGLARKGHQVAVFCRHSDLSQPDFSITASVVDGIDIIRVVNDYKTSVSFRDTFINERIEAIFLDYLQQTQPKIVHFNHLAGFSARLPLLCGDLGIPFIVTLHDYWAFCHQIRLIDSMGRICPGPLNGGDCAVCIQGDKPLSPRLAPVMKWIKATIPAQARRSIRRVLFPGKSLETQPTALAMADDDLEIRSSLFKRAILRAERILVPSAYVRDRYAANGYPRDRIDVLPLGINIGHPHAASTPRSGPVVFAGIGSFIPTKGFHILVQAFKQIPAENIRLQLYGRDDADPVYTEELKRLAGQDARIKFMRAFPPEQRDEVYNDIDALVLPSIAPETFSLVAREALVCGKPVLASRIGALPEIVAHGVNGFLFEPGNAHELAGILGHIAQSPEMLGQLDLPGPHPIPNTDEHAGHIEALYLEAVRSA